VIGTCIVSHLVTCTGFKGMWMDHAIKIEEEVAVQVVESNMMTEGDVAQIVGLKSDVKMTDAHLVRRVAAEAVQVHVVIGVARLDTMRGSVTGPSKRMEQLGVVLVQLWIAWVLMDRVQLKVKGKDEADLNRDHQIVALCVEQWYEWRRVYAILRISFGIWTQGVR
jgi:hypothetical protein